MKLTGYACRHPDPPLRLAYLPLGELTVLLGPNDSGKSSLLRAIERDLAGGHFGIDPELEPLIGGVFYAEVSDAELKAIVTTAASSRYRGGHGEVQSAPRPPWDDGLWSIKSTPEEDLGEDPVSTLLQILSERDVDPAEARDQILASLGQSRTLALECAGRTEPAGLLAWNAYWCLPPSTSLSPEEVAALEASDIQPFRRRRERASGVPSFHRGFYRAFHGIPEHLYVEGAPVAVVALGAVTNVSMPKGLAAPADFVALRDAVISSTTSLVNMMVRGFGDAARDEEYDAQERAERAAPRAWLVENDGWVGLSEETMAAAAFISAAANRLLPAFLSERYSIAVELRDVDEWFESDPLRLVVRARSEGPLIEDFAIEDVADGFRLWLQLALLNALEDAGRVTSLLGQLARDAFDASIEVSHLLSDGQDAEDEEEAERDATDRFQAVIRELKALEGGGQDWVSGELEQRLADVPGDDWTRGRDRDRWLLIVDEPERHLQPRLQREAARWLGTIASERHAPLVVSTHSPAFLSLPADASTYVSVYRTPDALRLEAFDPSMLHSLDELSQQMGYDRGELVGLIDVWLVVEGETDQAVLETLYRHELSGSGIEVVPLRGTSRWQALLESDALWRFTTAPVAVMFDGIGPEAVAELDSASDDELAGISRDGGRPSALRDMASLIRGLRRLGKTVHPVPNEGADILDLLDEESVRTVFPDYPGREEAEAAWIKHGRKGSHDEFLKRRFGVEKRADEFEAIARHMVENGKSSPQLGAAIAFCQSLDR